jgi:hypothetical protein
MSRGRRAGRRATAGSGAACRECSIRTATNRPARRSIRQPRLGILHPRILGRLGRLDRADPLALAISDGVGDPFDIMLDRDRHVGRERRIARAADRQQIGEAGKAHAEIGARPIRQPVGKCHAAAPDDVHRAERPGDGIIAGRKHDRVERIVRVAGADTGRRDGRDRRFAHVHDMDVRQVERLIIMRVERDALGPERIALRFEDRGLGGIGNDLAHLLAEEASTKAREAGLL